VHLVGFIIKKFVTMHIHMNEKKLHNIGYFGVLEIWKMKVKIRRKSGNRTRTLCVKLHASRIQKGKRNLEGCKIYKTE